MNKKTTIDTIAEKLGLSKGTISKVINGKGNVSTKTRNLVLNYIDKIGYVPSSSARMLKSKRTYTIGVIFSEELKIGLEHSFFSSILQSFKNFAEDKGYELSFIVRKLGKNQMSYYEWCLNKRVDGVYIVVGNYDDIQLLELINSDIPSVSTDMLIDGLHTVVGDNIQGINLIFDYIVNELRLTKTVFVSGPHTSKAFKERTELYLENYQKYGIDNLGVINVEGFGYTSGYTAALEIATMSNRPEVVMVSSDDIALGLLKGLSDNNIKVPDDINVIGYDDIPYAKHFTPPLTTIRQDRQMLGEVAANDLINLIEKNETQALNVARIPVELVIRETTKSK